MTDTWVIPVPTTTTDYQYTRFCLCSPNRTLDSCLFFLSQSEHNANEELNMHIRWPQTWWVILVPTTTHIPCFLTVAHSKLWIFTFLVISQWEQICKWGLKYAHWWQQSTWVVHVPITTHIPSFINVAHTELWIFDFLLLANQNRYANEVLNMRFRWRQTTWVVFVPSTTHIPSLTKIGHCVLFRERRFTFWCWQKPTFIHTSVHISRQRDKWKLSGCLAHGRSRVWFLGPTDVLRMDFFLHLPFLSSLGDTFLLVAVALAAFQYPWVMEVFDHQTWCCLTCSCWPVPRNALSK